MKKLKASEITEPGPYWMYRPETSEPECILVTESLTGSGLLLILRAGSNGRFSVKCEMFLGFYFIKAEPPKVCRWKFAGSLDMPFYALSCKDIFANIEMGKSFTYCPYCSGHIETEE